MLLSLSQGRIPLDYNVQNTAGQTALHLACELVSKDLVNTLLAKGANPNVKDNNGDTPLHIACRKKAIDVAKTLLANKNTNINIKNNQGKSPNQMDEIQNLKEILLEFTEKALSNQKAALGELEIALSWSNANDLDLHVICPHGFEIFYGAKNAPCCFGELDVDMNAGGPCSDTNPVEHVYWKRNVPRGVYKVIVDHYSVKCNQDNSKFLITIKHNNKLVYSSDGWVCHANNKRVQVTEYRV